MSTQHIPAAHRAAVFYDLESFGTIPPQGGAAYFNRLLRLIDAITDTVKRYGFTPAEHWAVDRAMRPHKSEDRWIEKASRTQLGYATLRLWEREVTIAWCRDTIADTVFIDEVRYRLKKGDLPGCVVFATNDGDMAPLAAEVRETQRLVVVVGFNYSGEYRGVAHRFVSAHALLHKG